MDFTMKLNIQIKKHNYKKIYNWCLNLRYKTGFIIKKFVLLFVALNVFKLMKGSPKVELSKALANKFGIKYISISEML